MCMMRMDDHTQLSRMDTINTTDNFIVIRKETCLMNPIRMNGLILIALMDQ